QPRSSTFMPFLTPSLSTSASPLCRMLAAMRVKSPFSQSALFGLVVACIFMRPSPIECAGCLTAPRAPICATDVRGKLKQRSGAHFLLACACNENTVCLVRSNVGRRSVECDVARPAEFKLGVRTALSGKRHCPAPQLPHDGVTACLIRKVFRRQRLAGRDPDRRSDEAGGLAEDQRHAQR